MADESPPLLPLRLDRREVSGAMGDLGTLVPLAILAIGANGLNPTVVFGLAGLTYVVSGLYYRIPMAVQPLKSFMALAIASCLSASVIGAGGILMGACLLLVGVTGLSDWLVRIIPKSLVRGIQLGVGLILIRVGAAMLVDLRPSVRFPEGNPVWLAPAMAAATGIVIALFLRSMRLPAGLLAVGLGLTAGLWLYGAPAAAFGCVLPAIATPAPEAFGTAAFLLVLPQLPLTLTNSVAAVIDTSRTCFGSAASRVTPRALSVGLGVANLAVGSLSGMPLCHGAGGVTAHHRFGARTGGATVFLGSVLLVTALAAGPMVADLCRLMPTCVLGALMVYVGAAHAALVRDTSHTRDWIVVLVTGVTGGLTNHNGYGLLAGIAVLVLTGRTVPRPSGSGTPGVAAR